MSWDLPPCHAVCICYCFSERLCPTAPPGTFNLLTPSKRERCFFFCNVCLKIHSQSYACGQDQVRSAHLPKGKVFPVCQLPQLTPCRASTAGRFFNIAGALTGRGVSLITVESGEMSECILPTQSACRSMLSRYQKNSPALQWREWIDLWTLISWKPTAVHGPCASTKRCHLSSLGRHHRATIEITNKLVRFCTTTPMTPAARTILKDIMSARTYRGARKKISTAGHLAARAAWFPLGNLHWAAPSILQLYITAARQTTLFFFLVHCAVLEVWTSKLSCEQLL